MHALAASLFARRSRLGLSIYAVVFGVFLGSRGEAWPHAWKLAGIETIGEMPTLGRGRAKTPFRNLRAAASLLCE
jgi:hypothetical protein